MSIAIWNNKEVDLSNIYTIMEGANHDSPTRLQYACIPFSIDKGAKGLKYQSNYFNLYGKIDGGFIDQDNFELTLYAPNFNSKNENAFDIDQNWELPLWTIFEMQRSFITNDGRIYTNEGLFNQGWNHYFLAMPEIIKDSFRLFNKLQSENEVNLGVKIIPYYL